jgi:2'-5' RNA ligase
MSVQRIRLFVAAPIPDEHLERIAEQVAPLRSELTGARWTKPESQHVTLKFLGPTPSDRFDEVVETVGSAAKAHGPGSVTLGSVGSFPSERRTRVLWIGLEDPDGLLPAIAADLDRGFEPLGFPAEQRAFTPHLTLARFRTPVRLDQLPQVEVADLPPIEVDHLRLYRSHLSPKGASYELLERFPLGS